jgi:hypothetical protein
LILIDSNIPMYLVGLDPARKIDTQRRLERLLHHRERLVTDAEVLQEILHRYTSIKRPDAIQPAFDAVLNVVDEVLAVDRAVLERAKQIVLGYQKLSARDAIHLAVMQQHGIGKIFSFDSGLDAFPGIARLV